MTSAKAIQIAKDIDASRCSGNWVVITELARRYKKYNSDGAVLEQTVLAEANLIQIITATRSKNPVNYEADAPHRVSMEDRLNPEQLKSIQDQLQAAIELSDPNNLHAIERDFARIVLARTYFECGQYETAVSIISQLSFEMDHVKQGYGLVLFLQARVIKAISFELTGNGDAAIQSYAGVEALLSENPNIKSKSFIEWSEEALYRAILVGLREGSPVPSSDLLEFMRQYQKMTVIQPAIWRTQKRMVVTRYSLRFVSTLYRQGQYRVPVGTVLPEGETDPQLERQIFIVEQSQLHTIYEKMLYLQVPLPKAGEVNTRVLDFVDQFANDFELIGTTAHDLRGFVEALDRASQRTFNSPLITRHLFSALVRLGEYEEAEQALHSYLYLVGLVSYGWKETRHDGQALATDKNGLNMPVPKPRPEIEDNESSDDTESYRQLTKEITGISDIKNSEKERVSDTLHVLITAIKMYCNDLGRGVDAVEMAEISKELYQKQPRRDRTSNLLEVGALVYRATGIAYGSLGCQTFDPELRPTYHEKALNYLKRSLELDSSAWETYYQLALQQADMHDIGQAVQSVTKAIQAQPSNVPSWHLLTLIISCPIHGDYRQALKTCEMGLQQAIDEGCPDIIEDSNGSGYDEAEQHMIFQMTRVLLLHALYGPEEALEFSKTLFGSFGKIAIPEASFSANSLENLSYGGAHNGMVISGSLGNLSELQISAERRRGRSASNSMVNHPVASSSTDLASHMGSRSHDSVNVATSKSTTIGRARSASNLAANPSPLGPGYNPSTNAGLLAVPDAADPKPHHHHHHHGLHLFGSRSSSNRTKAIENSAIINENTSIQSLNTPYDLKSLAGNSVASLQSISPSIASIQSILQPSVIPTKPSTRTVLRKQRSDRILSDLWLLTAQMFIKLGKLDEARKAVEEAENVDWISNPQVWCVLGQLLEAEGDFEQAQTAYNKSLVIDPNDVVCRLWLAKSHIAQSNREIAEGILEILTKSNGWDCAEAWFYLGEIYRQTDRLDRTKACLFYALELESTTPIQPFSVLPRYI
ncbi:hypothetical protein MFLAVUS_010460 [Mucor flavus]|uniref:TPR-like protein n=1 Tax=Mucor flavus TaxID=439312 RepID=A0ABP9ZCS7_9FUNG